MSRPRALFVSFLTAVLILWAPGAPLAAPSDAPSPTQEGSRAEDAREGAEGTEAARSERGAKGAHRDREVQEAPGGDRDGARQVPPRVRASSEAVLVEAGNEFSYGRYERVVSLLRDLVERDLLRERDDRLEALRLYGICLYLTGRRAAAGEIFRTLLRLEPEARLDPRLVQPEVVAAFEILRKEQAKGLQERARQELRRRHGIAAALPPWGQFQNGHWQKGAAVLGLELVFLGANIGSYYALRSDRLRQPDRTYVEKDAQGNVVKDHRTLAKALMAVNATSFALLLGTVVYGIVDGAVYHVRHRKRLKRLLGEGASLMAAPAPGGGAVCLTLQF